MVGGTTAVASKIKHGYVILNTVRMQSSSCIDTCSGNYLRFGTFISIKQNLNNVSVSCDDTISIPASLVLTISESSPIVFSAVILITVQSGMYGTVRGLEA